jgi:hypothetical protein
MVALLLLVLFLNALSSAANVRAKENQLQAMAATRQTPAKTVK